MMLYRKKPETIEAIQFKDEDGHRALNIEKMLSPNAHILSSEDFLEIIISADEIISVKKGDYVIKDGRGNIFKCSAELFDKIYEPEA